MLVLSPALEFTWSNKCKTHPILQHLDRFYVPMAWMTRVRSLEVVSGNFLSDHWPVRMEMGLTTQVQTEKPNLDFFRVNMEVAS